MRSIGEEHQNHAGALWRSQQPPQAEDHAALVFGQDLDRVDDIEDDDDDYDDASNAGHGSLHAQKV